MKTVSLHKSFNKWWTIPLFIIFILIWLWIGISSAQTKIFIKKNAVVPGPHISLGDVAAVESAVPEYEQILKEITLSIAPPINIPYKINKRFIEQKLKEHQVDLNHVFFSGAGETSVVLDTVIISGQRFLETARTFLEQSISVSNGNYEIEILRNPLPKPAPKRDVNLRVVHRKIGRLKGSFNINVGIFNGDKRYQIVPVYVRVRTYEPMIVAARDILMGTIISEKDIKLVVDESTKYNYDLVSDKNLVLGKQTRMTITENRPLLLKNLEIPPLIYKGDLVEIEVKRGRISVTCKGIAQKNGRLRDIIPVKRLDTRKEYRATVAGINKVIIQ